MTSGLLVHSSETAYTGYVNPEWVRLLDLLDINVGYRQCLGARLDTMDGRSILDCLSGYCVYNTGHNHPYIIDALKQELDQRGPVMVQSHVPTLAGELAERLCKLAGGKMSKVFFCSSGSEAVEAAIKFARARTGRSGLLACKGSFHGLTTGALSLMGDSFWRANFGPLLPDVSMIAFNDLEELEKQLRSKKFAAFVVEPIMGEGGIRLPEDEYLAHAQRLCRRYGTLFVVDEVQTGMFRTGKFLAAHHYGVEPDMVVLAKALSGGLVPVGALLMSEDIYKSVYPSLQHAIIHTSTYSENTLSMRVGLATLDVLEQESLGSRALEMGEQLRERLRAALTEFEMVEEIRGMGMLNGIVLRAPRQVALRVAFESCKAIHPGMLGQMMVRRLFSKHDLLTQICGNNFLVLKVAPPLVLKQRDVETIVSSMHAAISAMHGSGQFWKDALELGRRAVRVR